MPSRARIAKLVLSAFLLLSIAHPVAVARMDGLPGTGAPAPFYGSDVEALLEQRPALPSDGALSAASPNILYYEDFDDGVPQGWDLGSALWRVSNECFPAATPQYHLSYTRAEEPYYCTYSLGGNDHRACAEFSVDLTGRQQAILSWTHRYVVESWVFDGKYDVMTVEASKDAWASSKILFAADAHDPPEPMWRPMSADITELVGGPVSIRYCFDTVDGYYNENPGWFVDSVAIIVDARPTPGPFVYKQDFDLISSPPGWTFTGLWHVSSACSPNPLIPANVPPPTLPNYLGYNRDSPCDYDTGYNTGSATFSASLVGMTHADLSFYQAWDNEGWFGSYDRMYVDFSKDNGNTWVNKFYWDSTKGAQHSYVRWVIPFDQGEGYLGNVVQVRFRFDTVDGLFNDHRGWFIDDVQVTGG